MNEFQVDDYVMYTESIAAWKGFYIVKKINPDTTVVVIDKNGGRISGMAPDKLKLLYRPTDEEKSRAYP